MTTLGIVGFVVGALEAAEAFVTEAETVFNRDVAVVVALPMVAELFTAIESGVDLLITVLAADEHDGMRVDAEVKGREMEAEVGGRVVIRVAVVAALGRTVVAAGRVVAGRAEGRGCFGTVGREMPVKGFLIVAEVAVVVMALWTVVVEEGRVMDFFKGGGLVEAGVVGRRVVKAVTGLEVARGLGFIANTERKVEAAALGFVVAVMAEVVGCLEGREDPSSDEREGRESESHFIKSSSSTRNSNVGGDNCSCG